MTKDRGVTLSEIILGLAVLAVLSGALAPLVFQQIAKARLARAERDIAALAEAVTTFREDLKTYPDRSGGTPAVLGYLLTTGSTPGGIASWAGPAGSVAAHLLSNVPPNGAAYPTTGSVAWRGAYITEENADPWGRAYVISTAGMRGDTGIFGWIISAGPNGILETDDGDAEISSNSDDLGIRLR